ncbi:hypothetical protein V6N13_103468 [Hibiscus sabdariffa]
MDSKNPPEDPGLSKKQCRWDENPPDNLVSDRPLNTNIDCDSLPPATATSPFPHCLQPEDPPTMMVLTPIPPPTQLLTEPYGP